MEKNINTLIIVFIAGIILIAVILVLNSGQTKVITMGEQQKNAMTVSGNARLEVEPDQAEIYVRIETFDKKADRARDKNADVTGDVIKALKREGVEDIETASFYLTPRYDYNRNTGESFLEGYTAINVLKVTTEDVDNAGKFIDVAVDSGANSIQNVNFGLTKETQKKISGQALIRASEVASDKAKSLANSLGVNLGRIVSIQESNFNFVAFDVARAELADEKATTQIVPGKVDVSASVTLSYEIS